MYADRNFARWKLTRTDPFVDYYWGSAIPFQFEEEPVTLEIDVRAGDYRAAWVHPISGEVGKEEHIHHEGGPRAFMSPEFREDIALRVLRNP
jgi:hypothetical protein